MTWQVSQLAPVYRTSDRPAVILDAECALSDEATAGFANLHVVTDWLTLRRVWEEFGRGPQGDARVVIVVRSTEFAAARDLPWDIENAVIVTVISWPGPDEFREMGRELDREQQDALIRASRSRTAPVNSAMSEFLRAAHGVVLPVADAGHELDAVIRLRTSQRLPASAWRHVAPLVKGAIAAALCAERPDFGPLQAAWEGWLGSGTASPFAGVLESARVGIVALLAAGLLRSASRIGHGLPDWTRIGAREPDERERLADLLAVRPSPWPPAEFADWMVLASWWGDVRASAAIASPVTRELTDALNATWQELDDAFQVWLRDRYPLLFSSTRVLPVTVNRIAQFLARRLRSTGRKQLLVVLDGMGFAQWSRIRQRVPLAVREATACCALCPTLTSVSRQAIFAGTLPTGYASSLWSTQREEALWKEFWVDAGVPADLVRYYKTSGATPADCPSLGDARVFGLVVNAVDEMLHGAEILGDASVIGAVDVWARHAFLEHLVRRGHDERFDVWLTADHGNVEATATGRVFEGLRVDVAGTRVRVYDNSVLRDAARADGVAWAPPGLPEGGKAFLFAPGRTGYHSGGPKVSHGGLSLDEVLVPFVRVEPQ